MSPITVLLKARALLERDGWCKYAARFDGARCTVSALIDAADGDQAALSAAANAMSKVLCTHSIRAWNDSHGVTMFDALDALDRAAGMLEAQSDLARVAHVHI